MPKKIAFIGAGSFGFTRSLVRDILSFEAFHDATIALMDIDAERLDYIYRACRRIAEEGKYPATIIATTDRKEALTEHFRKLETIWDTYEIYLEEEGHHA